MFARPLHRKMIEKHASPPPSVFGEFLCFSFTLFTVGPDNCVFISFSACALARFATGESRRRQLEYYLHRICFVLPPHFYFVVLVLIDYFISQVLALSEKQREKRAAELVQVAKIAEMEVVARSQADKITVLEATCADLKHEKDKVTDGY
jgi:hypothetical protein